MRKTTFSRALAFDFGHKRIGVAFAQSITGVAKPIDVVKNQEGTPDFAHIQRLIDTWQPDTFVVGLPLNMAGKPMFTTNLAKKLAALIEKQFPLPTHLIDERLTTKAAREAIFDQGGYKALQTQSVDAYAAKLILESWIQANKPDTEPR